MMGRYPRFAWLGVVLALGLAWARPAEAQARKPLEIVRVRVGLADCYKLGCWTPVEVFLRGTDEPRTGRVSIEVPDGDNVPTEVATPPERPCQVLPGVETSVLLYVRIGQLDAAMTVRFESEGRLLAKRVFETGMEGDDRYLPSPLLSTQQLIVVVGDGKLGLEKLTRSGFGQAEAEKVVATLDDVGQLPTRWYGYEGVDALVLCTHDVQRYRPLRAEGARVQALQRWIRNGGRLLLSVGSQADEVLDERSPLAQFAPGKLKEVISLRQTGALETYSGGNNPMQQGAGRSELRVPRLAEPRGVVEADESGLPLVIRAAEGFGQIVFLAFDLQQAPVNRWKDRGQLVARALQLTGHGEEDADQSSAMMHYGYQDMAGQLRSALDRFTGVRLVPFSLVALLVLVYILLIGPGDYFLLRKVFRRMELTWITFPTIVVLVSVGAYFLAYQLKGRQTRVNQVDVVDVDMVDGYVRGTTWLNLFSPRTSAYQVGFRPQLPGGGAAAEAEQYVAWLGLPGEALGGMSPRTISPSLWRRRYRFSPDLQTMNGVPVQVWSTKSFTTRWFARTEPPLEIELEKEADILRGTIVNTLDVPLDGCILAYRRWVYQLGNLAPGQAASIGELTKRSELDTLLTGRKLIFDDAADKFQQESTPYDQASLDVGYIVRTMMFYKAAGGRRYTGLLNRYQGFIDMSDLLEADRAILMGLAPPVDAEAPEARRGSILMCNGEPMARAEDRHTGFFRFLIPVERAKASAARQGADQHREALGRNGAGDRRFGPEQDTVAAPPG
jgi:hypothetical protein